MSNDPSWMLRWQPAAQLGIAAIRTCHATLAAQIKPLSTADAQHGVLVLSEGTGLASAEKPSRIASLTAGVTTPGYDPVAHACLQRT